MVGEGMVSFGVTPEEHCDFSKTGEVMGYSYNVVVLDNNFGLMERLKNECVVSLDIPKQIGGLWKEPQRIWGEFSDGRHVFARLSC